MAELIAPSIGLVELSYDEKGNRVRGIIPHVVENNAQLFCELFRADVLASQTGATRRIVRGVVRNGAIENFFQNRHLNGWRTEAWIPLSGAFRNHAYIYFANNDLQRVTQPQVFAEEMDLLRQVQAKPPKDPRTVLEHAVKTGYVLQRLYGQLPRQDIDRLAQMYRASFTSYPFDIENTIVAMIANLSSHVYGARRLSDGKLYAVAATELVFIPQLGFAMREMGDSAKMPEVNGLNAPLKLMLAYEAFKDNANLDLLFCETRAALGAVNAVNHSIDMRYSGLLPKHTVISGPEDVHEVTLDGSTNGQYGNMNVWAFNNDALRKIAKQVYFAL